MVALEVTPIRDRRPLAVQVYDRLLDALITSENEGLEVPTELELVAKLGVSRTTVRGALALLEEDGVLVRGPGRRRFVATATAASSANNPPLEHMLTSSAAITVRGVTRSVQTATRWSAGLLGIAPGSRILMWESVLLAGGKVVASALEATTPDWGGSVEERDDATLLSALGPAFRARATPTHCRVSAHTASTRGEFDGGIRSDGTSIVITQVHAIQGRPAYLAKNVVRLRDVSVLLEGAGLTPDED